MARVFISYSQKDRDFLEDLKRHLSMLKRQGLIEVWDDYEILAGDEWNDEIRQNMEAADIFLLLVTQNFLSSDFCYQKEMTYVLERHKSGDALVIPLKLKPCEYDQSPLAHLAHVPRGSKAITTWGNQDEAFYEATKQIRKSIENFAEKQEQQIRPTPRLRRNVIRIASMSGEPLELGFAATSHANGVIFFPVRPLPSLTLTGDGIAMVDAQRVLLTSSAEDTLQLVRRLSELSGIGFRLPTRIEWERALQEGGTNCKGQKRVRAYGADIYMSEYTVNGCGIAIPPVGGEEWIAGGALRDTGEMVCAQPTRLAVASAVIEDGRLRCSADYGVSGDGRVVRAAIRLVYNG